MAKRQSYLKTKNVFYLWTFIAINCAVFLAVIIGDQFSYQSVQHFWERIRTKDGIIAVCMPFIAIILNGILGDLAKARLVFLRWRNPLPGSRVFSVLMNTDPRIDVAALKRKHGSLPRSPKDQNVLWYQLYKKHAAALTISEAHRLYLLTRDMTAISAVFTFAFPLCAFFSSTHKETAFYYTVALVGQYLILSASARNYGNRFVLNVVTEESHSK
jgi:hypothetical protein